MSLRFVLGGPGTGKTEFCLNEIVLYLKGRAAGTETALSRDALYYLVPEQFTLQSEKRLLRAVPAFTGAQVISFNRLAEQLFAKAGGIQGSQAGELGRCMLLRRILYDCKNELTYYARSCDKPGFIEGLAGAISEFNQYQTEPEALAARAEKARADRPGFAEKLNDLALLLGKYREAVRGRYLLPDETLSLLSADADKFKPLRGGMFWADGFTGFTPQERGVLAAVFKTAERVTVSLTVRDGGGPDTLCETARETRRLLTELARSLNVEVEPPVILETNHRNTGELSFYASRFTVNGPVDVYGETGGTPQIAVISAPDNHAEVHEAARRIIQMVEREHYRFRDIALLCGVRERYEKPLRNVFGRLGIPVFIDSKTDILSHPLIELTRAAVDVAARNWPYDSVFRFLKTRFTPLDAAEVDILENYALAHGVKGFYWKYPFRDERAEAARRTLLAALAPFTDGLYPEKKESIREFSARAFAMLYALNAPETLGRLHAERAAAGDHELARAHAQVWPKLCEVFDKLVEILGDDRVTLREFAKILDAGLARADLGLIPPAADQVVLCDAWRSRFPAIRALFVLGANENMLPPPDEPRGLFSDDEREWLRDGALALAAGREGRAADAWFALYNALCQPSERLFLLYAQNGQNNSKPQRPAKILRRLKEMFPDIAEERAAPYAEYEPVGAAATVYKLSGETLKKLYGGATVITAASRVEKYAGCPFAYFVTYNLRARERAVYQVHAADLGVVFHEVLALFSRRTADEGIPWGSLDKAAIAARVNDCVEAVVNDDAHVLRSSARNRYILDKVKRVCATSVWALTEHVRRGAFTPAGIELDFTPDAPVSALEIPLGNGRRLILTGRIDRVDIMKADGHSYVKIIDYKSGDMRFSLENALLGTQLQLILYMNALLKNGRALLGASGEWRARPGGAFYFHIDDPLLPADTELAPDRREEMLLKCFRMSGLALADASAVAGMDAKLLEDGGESLIIPVAVNKNGAFSKTSSVADLETFEQIGKAVTDKIKEVGLKMTEGVISPDPCAPDTCDYCRYGNICRYNV